MSSTIHNKNLKKVKYNPFSAGAISMALPTSESQREIWATLALDKEASLCYNEALELHLEGQVDEKVFQRALLEVINRHDALRSVFSQDGKYFFIKEKISDAFKFQDWSGDPDQVEKITAFKKAEVLTPIDLVNGPCFFSTFIKLNSQKSVVFLTAHHIICDGWSFAVILSELSSLYAAMIKNVPFEFDEASQFNEFATEESRSGVNTQHRNYWVEEFTKPLETKGLPLDLPRPSYRTYQSDRFDIEIPTDLARDLKKFGAKQGCSLYTVLMGAFQVLLSDLSNAPELVVGMASAAQSDLGKHDLVGHLVNLLPLRMKMDRELQFKTFLKSLRGKMLDAFDHQKYSYGPLLKELNLKRNPAEIPLLSVVFNIDQQSPGQGLRFDSLKASYLTIPRKFENFELFVNAVSCEDTLVLECQFNTNLFKVETIRNWFENYISALKNIVSNQEIKIADIQFPDLYRPEASGAVITLTKTELVKNAGLEEKMSSLWKKLLHLESLSSNQNFFSLGGHSLLAVELVNLSKEELDLDLTVREIFENPTVEELVSCLSMTSSTPKNLITQIPMLAEREFYPVTHNQMQVWYLEELHPQTKMHNLPSSIRLKFKVQGHLLQKSLELLVARHPSMRTCIEVKDGEPVQRVLPVNSPELKVSLEVYKARESEIQNLLNQDADAFFDKTQAPLFKAKLYELGSEDFVFFFMAHHGIWDGWSFDIFFEELNIIYSALSKSERPEFQNNPKVSYADYSVWMHESLKEGALHSQLEFWKTQLATPLPIIDLPTDFKRPVTASHEGHTFPFELNSQEIQKVKAYAKEQGTSVFNVLLTAFKVTLSRYCNQEDVIVGSPVRARNHTDLLNTIGYFVNTVALRSFIQIDKSFEENLKTVSNVCMEAFDHQDIPFQVVLNNIEYAKDSSRTPIFQTFFSYQDVSNRSAELNGQPYTQINIDKASTHTDLDLWIKSSNKKIEGAFEFRADLFNAKTVERFYECFMLLVSNLAENQNLKLKELAVIPPNQSQIVLKEWNQTLVQNTEILPFHKMFEKAAKSSPDALAIENAQGGLTYKELDYLSNKVARSLVSLGVVPGDLVGISLSRDLNMMVTLIAILKAGAGYVPLDPAFPQDRLDYMIESAGPKKLITESKLQSRFNKVNNILLIDDLLRNSESDEPLNLPVDLTSTMYVIYTSGSTGKPKGVQISHGALTNFLVSMQKEPGIALQDKLLAVTTLSFDIATLELYLPLSVGSSLYLASSFDVMDGKALKNIIESRNITLMQATPSTWRLLLAAGWEGASDFTVLCGGEAFPIDLARKLISQTSAVWNMYGPTETTVWSTCKKLSAEDEAITVGRPIDNTTTYILDAGLNLAPIGAPGELYIGGKGLADGYFGRPDLTSERFITNPFEAGTKIYATGDYARLTPQGEIECLGRQDGQVKVRGYRIELGEIEATLSDSSQITHNAVITKEVRAGDVRIIAFVVISGNELNEKELRAELGVKMPHYMIPSHFVVLNDLPKTLNGKIDKKTLGTMFKGQENTQKPIAVVPASFENLDEVSQKIRGFWVDILGVEAVSLKDNFFTMGGNSILAVQLFSKIAKTYQMNLPLSLLLESANLEDFIQKVKTRLPGNNLPNAYTSLVSIKSSGNKNPVFCFHSVGGNVLNYVSLVPALPENRPLVGMQSQGMSEGQELITSIEQMAQHYIKEMKVIQPQGPYYLAGGSMGGMIAFEVAQQLSRAGDKIEKIVMFDTFGPNINIKSFDKTERNFWTDLKVSLSYRKKILLNALKTKLIKLLGLSIPLEIRLFEVERNNYRALWNYKATSYSGDIHIIRAPMRSSGWYSDPKMGWSGVVTGNIKCYEINGNHGNFIEEPELGKVFTKLL